ncbi:glycine receptor subunit alpha-2-like [Limulus polyphemus]|uniref:Glycine receptor subunit alpha-2-like n=1 Tax=Limulus polyphemus TaxID=6850 RepID=A0ABM1TRQ5_LIMPO|nr:glycine receptor subunit alpha-2-like [Limulus polyphemus]
MYPLEARTRTWQGFYVLLLLFSFQTVGSYNGSRESFEAKKIPRTEDLKSLHNVHHQEEAPRLSFLDKVLQGYDKRVWPTYGTGKPTPIKVNVYINSLGSISAANMEYRLDIYLRQSWQDHRLHLASYGIYETVTLNAHDLINRIWKPDLFFRNVKEAAFHLVTVPNMLIKVSPEGRILYSMRLTLRLSCHMSFRHYPLDTQHCYVLVGP